MGRIAVACVACVFLLSLIHSSVTERTIPGEAPRFEKPLYDSLSTDFSDYIWPTDAGRLITSVFAEYRSTHFHGGIDISTGDRTGFHVFASRDGYVARIYVAPNGYGNMLWLRHKDGYYTTYAHLRNFAPYLDSLVAREQTRLERFPVDITCLPGQFPVKKGDIVAYTGETGTGSPHLHFEIRDPNKNFVNPFLCTKFTYLDDIPPFFYAFGIVPLGAHSRVNGSFAPKMIDFRNPVQGATLRDTIFATGSIGFAVDVRDRINGSRFRSGVYRHSVFLDDSLICAIRFDRAPSSGDFQIGLYYDFPLMTEEGGRIASLYMDSPHRLPFFSPQVENPGVIRTDEFRRGPHRFRVVTTDFRGNSSTVTGVVVFSSPVQYRYTVESGRLHVHFPADATSLQFSTTLVSRSGRQRWRREHSTLEESTIRLADIPGAYDVLKIQARDPYGYESGPLFYAPPNKNLPHARVDLTHQTEPDFVRVFLRTDGVFTSPPTIVVVEGDSSRKLAVEPVDYNEYTATFQPRQSYNGKRSVIAECDVNGRLVTTSDAFAIYPILPFTRSEISIDDGRLIVIADSSAVYKPLYLEVEKLQSGPEVRYALQPRHTVLDGGLTVKLRDDDPEPHQGLFFRRRSSWTLLSPQNEGKVFSGNLGRTLGDVGVLTDAIPPAVSRLRLPGTSRKGEKLSFRVRDNFSGVEYNTLKLYIDGVFAIPEIDGEHRRVEHRFTEPLTRGSHTLVILLKDRIGNANEIRRTFTVR